MRRLTVVAVGLVVGTAVLAVAPGAEAQLPKDKDWSWQHSVDGEVEAVAVCEGFGCASDRSAASTANTVGGGDQDNLYSFPRSGNPSWAWNVEGGTDQSSFAMTGTDVTDDGDLIVGVSDEMANQGLTADDHGPFWVREATGSIVARADDTDIRHATNSSDRKLTTWLPGTDAFAMVHDPGTTDADGRVWVYTGATNSQPYANWTRGGESVGATEAVDVAATSELLVAGFNDGSATNVALFDQESPAVTGRIDADDGGVDATLEALDASRNGDLVVVGTDDDKAVVLRVSAAGGSVSVDRVGPVFTDSPVTAVAVSADGERFAVGGSFGIASYELTDDAEDPFELDWSWSQGTSGLDMSQDGLYLASQSSSGVRFFWNTPSEGQEPVLLWTSSDLDGEPVSIDTGYSGSGTIVGDDSGNVYFFDLDYGLSATVDPSSRALDPGQPNGFTLTLENTGDALDELTLSASGPQASWVAFETENGSGAPLSGVTLVPDQTRTVSVQVTPPPGTPAGSSFQATLEAEITSSPDDVTETVPVSGTVRESYGVNLAADPPSLDLRQGETRTVDLTVTNAGNLQDRIIVDVGTLSEGWTATVGRNSFPLDAGASDNTTLTIRAPDQADQGTTEEVRIQGTSEGDPSEVGRLTVPATVGPSTGVSLSGPGTIEARAGEPTPLDVTVENVGNQPSTFDLSLEAPGTWAVALSADTITLDALETGDVQITVTPPGDAGGAATVQLTAVAQGDTSASSTLAIIVSVTRGFLGLPGFGPVAAVAALGVGLWTVSRRRR